MKWALLLILLCAGCHIEKFNKPPTWASAVSTHTRFFGIKANVPVGGGEVMGVTLGWGSSTYTVLPVATNQVFIPKFSDTFSTGQSINPWDTRIKEWLQTGYDTIPEPAKAMLIFQP